ncbi:hypothetical protein ACFW1A_28050 [Kitasatospora sp. NPDC058965]|uniref:hypothetical protein n=1 Tax=Kitasatospora sp. NPDC058965 TaxID=3346682 RepID=UPI003698822C
MGELRGVYKVHFGVALTLGGTGLLCMASTWLPGAYVVPKWFLIGLFAMVFPVFIAAMFRGVGAARLMGRENALRLVRYVLLLPPVLKLGYALVLGLAVLGLATAGGAQDAQADASGYYYTYWDQEAQPPHEARVDLTEPQYYAALKSQDRILTAFPVLFYAVSSFLVLASASAAAGARTATPGPRPRSRG